MEDLAFNNSEGLRGAEIWSSNVMASARGLAKFGAYMANKGTAFGETIMCEDQWYKFHGNRNEKYDYGIGALTVFTDGGVGYEQETGYYGWSGYGGSSF